MSNTETESKPPSKRPVDHSTPDPKTPTHVMSFDVEALGQTPRVSGMVELAACVWKIGEDHLSDSKYFFFGTDARRCPRTWDEFWNNREKSSTNETPWDNLQVRLQLEKLYKYMLGEAAAELVAWAREWYQRTDGLIIVITDTPGFDYQFISDMLACLETMPGSLSSSEESGASPPYSLNYLFGKYQPVCDINSFYKGQGGVLCKWGARRGMEEKLAVQKPKWLLYYEDAYDHNPVNDACAIAARAAFYLGILHGPTEKTKKKAKTTDGQ